MMKRVEKRPRVTRRLLLSQRFALGLIIVESKRGERERATEEGKSGCAN